MHHHSGSGSPYGVLSKQLGCCSMCPGEKSMVSKVPQLQTLWVSVHSVLSVWNSPFSTWETTFASQKPDQMPWLGNVLRPVLPSAFPLQAESITAASPCLLYLTVMCLSALLGHEHADDRTHGFLCYTPASDMKLSRALWGFPGNRFPPCPPSLCL